MTKAKLQSTEHADEVLTAFAFKKMHERHASGEKMDRQWPGKVHLEEDSLL